MDKNVVKMPLVSVLMPVYNSENYVKEAIISILNQTFKDIELIIINDGSTDRSEEVILSFVDDRIRYHFNKENLGVADSLNLGIDLAKGTYIVRMDSDDISVLNRIEKQVLFMENNPDIICSGSGYKFIHKAYEWLPKERHEEIMLSMIDGCPMAHPTVILKAITLRENNIKYDKTYEPAEDYKMWTTLSNFGRLGNIRECLLNYRVHSSQISNINNINQHKIGKLIKEEFLYYLIQDTKLSETLLVENLTPENYSNYLLAEKVLINSFNSIGVRLKKRDLNTRKEKLLLAYFSKVPFLSLKMLRLIPILLKSRVGLLSFSKSFIKKMLSA